MRSVDEDLRYLRTPPESSVVQPPTRTRPQLLPFEELKPRDFERLCLRLADAESDVEYAQLYGVPGQRQDGIDVNARRRDGSYVVYQARRVETITPGAIKGVVDDFLAGGQRSIGESGVLLHVLDERTDSVERLSTVS
jgi:hypothetical protein